MYDDTPQLVRAPLSLLSDLDPPHLKTLIAPSLYPSADTQLHVVAYSYYTHAGPTSPRLFMHGPLIP